MADTILILGNGFDLAMGRKTSYKDFLEFADKLFVERDDQLDEFLKKHQIDIEKYRNNLYIQYINENKSTLGLNQKIANGYLMYASWFKEEEK